MYGAHVQLIHEQVKKMLLFGKDNFTEIISIPDDSEISTNSEVKLVLTPIRKGAFFYILVDNYISRPKILGEIFSLKILYYMSYSIICLVFPNTLIDSCIVNLPVAFSNCCLNWFKGFRVSCIKFSKLISAEC